MTTYAFKITLRETEMIVIKKALAFYIKHCEDEIDKSNGRRDEPPSLYVMRETALEISSGLYLNPRQTSGNNFHNGRDI